MSRPTDIEIALNRWTLSTRLEDLVDEIEAVPMTGPEAPANACFALGRVIGQLDFLIAELRNTTVTIDD